MNDDGFDPFADDDAERFRLVDPVQKNGEGREPSLRPEKLKDFIGQHELKENLSIFIEAAKRRDDCLDHVLFFGPPGLGKTTLAQIISKEMGVGLRATSGPVISKAGDLAAILTNLQPKDVLFIDEIHRLNIAVEEILYPAMEDFSLDLIIGEGPAARSVRIDLPPFTLVGATTRAGMLANPLRDRFGVPLRLDYYSPEDLSIIINNLAAKLSTTLDPEASLEIARRSRGTPRIAGRLLRRVRDFAEISDEKTISVSLAKKSLTKLNVDDNGLDLLDRRYLKILVMDHSGGPVGADTIAAALSESRDALEDIIEPFLIQKGYIARTPRGRVATPIAYEHFGLPQRPGNDRDTQELGVEKDDLFDKFG